MRWVCHPSAESLLELVRPCGQALCRRLLLVPSIAALGHLRPASVLFAPQEQFPDSSQIKEDFTQLHRGWGKDPSTSQHPFFQWKSRCIGAAAGKMKMKKA